MYSFQRFFKYIEKLGAELEKNLTAAGISRDPEVVHRCRVAIRRLRGILGLFHCESDLLEEIKKLGAALGHLRDIEVQLEFLKKVDLPMKEKKSILASKLLEWEMERLRVSSLHLNFSSAEFIKKISKSMSEKKISPYAIYKTLLKRSRKVIGCLSQEPFESYHTLRISLKKTRYLLEAVEVLESEFRESIDNLKEFQDCLGEIHDIEVWIQEVSAREKLPVLKKALQDRKTERIYGFNRMKGGIYQLLEETLNTSASLAMEGSDYYSQELLSLVFSPEEKKRAAELFASQLSPDPHHAIRVADKCRTIFTSLGERTGLKEADLEILFCAALLHDIGHYPNEKEHHINSYNLIKASSCLPFNISERERVAIVARNHRKKPHFNTDLLNLKEIEKLRLLSGILRCADGMELESYEYVDHFTVTLSSNTLIFRGSPLSIVLRERF